VFVNPAGPHHLVTRSGSRIAANTRAGLAGMNLCLASERFSTGSMSSPIVALRHSHHDGPRRVGTKKSMDSGSKHELPNGAAHGEQLRTVHAADDLADDGAHYLLRARHAEVG